MGRYSPGHSYGHGISYIGWDCYRLRWTVDRYYKGSRLRFPTTFTRDTDEAGAIRFARRWTLPNPKPTPQVQP